MNKRGNLTSSKKKNPKRKQFPAYIYVRCRNTSRIQSFIYIWKEMS